MDEGGQLRFLSSGVAHSTSSGNGAVFISMGWKEFAASIIGDLLSWPVVILVVVLLLLTPLKKLIGRVKGAKGFGGEVEFNELVESAEKKVNKVLDEDSETADRGAESGQETTIPNDSIATDQKEAALDDAIEGRPRVDPSTDPSAAILTSWNSLVATLADLSRSTAGRGRPATNPRAILDQLRRNEQVSRSFYEAVNSLYEVRNQVAHGEAIPTRGVAFAYVDQANQLQSVATGMLAVEKMDLDRPAP